MAGLMAATDLVATATGFQAQLDPGWDIWGPAGGYIAALALRAVREQASARGRGRPWPGQRAGAHLVRRWRGAGQWRRAMAGGAAAGVRAVLQPLFLLYISNACFIQINCRTLPGQNVAAADTAGQCTAQTRAIPDKCRALPDAAGRCRTGPDSSAHTDRFTYPIDNKRYSEHSSRPPGQNHQKSPMTHNAATPRPTRNTSPCPARPCRLTPAA